MTIMTKENVAKVQQQMATSNPTVAEGKTKAERVRVPLSVPQRKLEVEPIPGYHLRWIRGTVQRLQQAEAAGFTFVTPEEVSINNTMLGGDASTQGSTDMGSRVSVVEGAEIEGGQAVRMYLMKQPMQFYLEDAAINQQRNDSIAAALTQTYSQGAIGGRAPGETSDDVGNRYVDAARSKLPDLFRKKQVRPS